MAKSKSTTTHDPRPKGQGSYPPAHKVLVNLMVDLVWRSGVVGIALTYALEPAYRTMVAKAQAAPFNLPAPMVFSSLLFVVHTGPYIVINLLFYLFDRFDVFKRYKIGRKPHMVPEDALIRKTLTEAAISQLIVTPILGYFLFSVFSHFGMDSFDAPLPSPVHMFQAFIFAHVFNETNFYWTHRLLHSQSLYATFHKQHHNYKGSIGIAAEYAGPLEAVLSNQFPTLGGILFFGTHPLVVAVWIVLRLKQTYEVHSGYCFAGSLYDKLGLSHSDAAAFHDYHHTVNRGNFGTEWLDWMFGTMDGYVDMGMCEGYVEKLRAP